MTSAVESMHRKPYLFFFFFSVASVRGVPGFCMCWGVRFHDYAWQYSILVFWRCFEFYFFSQVIEQNEKSNTIQRNTHGANHKWKIEKRTAKNRKNIRLFCYFFIMNRLHINPHFERPKSMRQQWSYALGTQSIARQQILHVITLQRCHVRRDSLIPFQQSSTTPEVFFTPFDDSWWSLHCKGAILARPSKHALYKGIWQNVQGILLAKNLVSF